MKYSVVVPCYNEEKNLDRLMERFDPIHKKLFSMNKELELILVENGSSDNSHDKIETIVQNHTYVKEVRVKVNQGYGYGILQGLAVCTGEFLFWIHADLQLPPEAILDMIAILDKSDDPEKIFLKSARRNRPLIDRFFTFGMGIFESIYLGAKLRDINAQPTGIPRSFYESWSNPPYDFSLDLYTYYLAMKSGLKLKRVPVIQSERTEGASSWNTGMASRIKMVKRTLSYSKILKKRLKRGGSI